MQQGDTIDIEVAGLPELHQHSTVQPDGAISFPLVGAMKVQGLAPSALREAIASQLARKIYRQRATDGHEILVVIEPQEVSASIVAYRPIYVTGDVAKPGEQTFRPEMTARQAIALAGGVDALPLRSGKSPSTLAALRSDRELTLVDLAKASAAIASISAEMNDSDSLASLDFGNIPLPKDRLDDIVRLQSDVLKARLGSYRRQLDFLRAASDQANSRIDVVKKLQSAEEQGASADTTELQRLTDLLSRGQETGPRVTDARRALLLSSTRALQISVELLDLQRQRSESVRAIQKYDDDRRVALLKELQDAGDSAARLRIKEQGIETALRLAPGDPSNPSSGVEAQLIDVIRQSATIRREPASMETRSWCRATSSK